MLGGVPHLGELPGQSVRVTCFAGVSFLHVKAVELGNPPSLNHLSVASYYDDFTSKTTETLMKLTVLAII